MKTDKKATKKMNPLVKILPLLLILSPAFAAINATNETALNQFIGYVWMAIAEGGHYAYMFIATLVNSYGETLVSLSIIALIAVAIFKLVNSTGGLSKLTSMFKR